MPAASVRVARDARIAGIADTTLEAVQRRRSHLFLALLITSLGLALATVLAPLGASESTPVNPGLLRLGLVGVSLTFLVYAVEKERALRRLERALHREHARQHQLIRETERLHRLVAAGHTMSASLDLDQVVDLALDGALSLFDASSGAVFLDRGDLTLQAVRGEPRRLDIAEQRARTVTETRTPALLAADDTGTPAGIAAPLLHNEQLVGVLVVDGPRFDDADLGVIATFAAHMATAIANARAYRAERAVNEQFGELHNVRNEFGWLTAKN